MHSAICQHPMDGAACRAALVDAYEAGWLEGYCVTGGLREGYQPCIEIVTEGFRQRENEELLFASEKAILWSFREDVTAGKAILERELRNYILAAIRQRQPSGAEDAEDVYQGLWEDLERRWRKPAPLKGHIRPYVWVSASRKAIPPGNPRHASQELPEEAESFVHGRISSGHAIPPGVTDRWRDYDDKLAASRMNDLIDRIILGQGMALAWPLGKRIATKELRADWAHLGTIPPRQLEGRIAEIRGVREEVQEANAAQFCAFLVNHSLVETWELPLVLAIQDGLDEGETVRLVERLAESTVSFIDQRVVRVVSTLREARDDD